MAKPEEHCSVCNKNVRIPVGNSDNWMCPRCDHNEKDVK